MNESPGRVVLARAGRFAVNGAHAWGKLVIGSPVVGRKTRALSATASGISGRPMRSSSPLRGVVAVKNAHS